jgi:hypothetical protein
VSICNSNPNPNPNPNLLGLAASPEVLIKRLTQACKTTGLEFIDFAIVECDESTFRGDDGKNILEDTVACLEQLCEEGIIQSYGLNISVSPYNYHTPAIKSSSLHAMSPSFVETTMSEGGMPHADLMIYPISPTNAIPHTYPLLDPDPENYDAVAEGDRYDSFLSRNQLLFWLSFTSCILCFQIYHH